MVATIAPLFATLTPVVAAAACLFAEPRTASAQDTAAVESPPVVNVTGPTVIAFWTVPESDAELESNELLAMALDDQQYYWAATRDSLEAIGVRPAGQPGRSFVLRDSMGDRTIAAHPDSSDIGYVLVAPGRPIRLLYRLRYPDQLTAEARAYFDDSAAGPDARTTPIASWLPLFTDVGLSRLENENRITELCADAEPEEMGPCYEQALATSVEIQALHAAPDPASERIGELIVTTAPGRGLDAFFRPAGSDEPVRFTPDLYLSDWGYGPYYHQTVAERRGAWFQLPRRPWPDPVWIHRPDQLESSWLHEVRVGEILEMHGEGWFVLEIEPDALVMRPEQEADMWCRLEEPPPLDPVEPTRFTRAELVDADGHLVVRPRYMKGC